ncbi:hypothetical protein MCOR25_011020 [Pyricularia grisea]|uniref:Uncharacterized protein n=1 Tax=Pyricularia grisea TaxID=148305 RepID=A0A6P8BHQ6_PYRGI|nr:uncharacterized protein PgNI_01246 [Pyricularia grisea]KAI6345777.1 hypothetical protein MCOR25_011020 [Pyricularia grisea]TLD16177.1 hypothetical protein PgNI_01246 [Pyricularia grisea]
MSFLQRRQDPGTADPAVCTMDETANDWYGVRIASIFVILVGSLLGAAIPIYLVRYRNSDRMGFSKLAFFVSKYFGTGVIVSTAFMHLISPADEILGMDCLKPLLGDYDWSMAIVLMTVMAMFFIEMIGAWFENRSSDKAGHGHALAPSKKTDEEDGSLNKEVTGTGVKEAGNPTASGMPSNIRGEDHLGHGRAHNEGDSHVAFAGKMTSMIILEAGVILHSVFIGLTLAVSSEFIVLFVVLVFHQTFEGLGLGSRLATFDWPADKRRWTPWIFALLYGLTTPIAIAVGLSVKNALEAAPTTRYMVEGISNAISGGILLYTGLVELLAHEFIFNPEMDRASLRYKLFAFGCIAAGAGLMALLANWA